MRRVLGLFLSDAKGLSNIEFAMAAASLAIAISAGILAMGLGLESSTSTRYAAVEESEPDPVMTGSVKTRPEPVAGTVKQTDCPQQQPPVVILRR